MVDLEEIRKRAEKATPGPWSAVHKQTQSFVDYPKSGHAYVGTTSMWSNGNGPSPDSCKANADFIAHARTDIPALLAALDAKTAEVERERAAREAAQGMITSFATLLDCGTDQIAAQVTDLKRQLAEARKQLGAFVGAWDECAGEEGDTFPQRFTDAVVRNLNAQEIKHD